MRTISILVLLCAVTLTACLIDTRTPASAETLSESCGNGILDPDEECDHGAQNSDSSACLSSCRLATCGDGYINPAYEQCDDGNRNTEECEYGLMSCTVCDADCQEAPGEVAFCGDGLISPQEVCDDGNLTCGTCNSECQDLAWPAATGRIRAPIGSQFDPNRTETFTLNDGFHEVTFEFELEEEENPIRAPQAPTMKLNGSNVVIMVHEDWGTQQVADAIAESINDSSLLITAESDGAGVWLTHSLPGQLGYKEILEDVATSYFWTYGMDGEPGYDCAYGESCSSDEDCETDWCMSGVCWVGG